MKGKSQFKHVVMILSCIFIFTGICIQAADITIEVKNEYPVVRINNQVGNDIVFQPVSQQEGSIGYQKNGKMTWIKGNPDLTESDKAMIYTWKTDGHDQVVLKVYINVNVDVEGDAKDVNMSLSLQNEDASVPEGWAVRIKAAPDEYFTGLFERVVDGNQNLSWKEGIQTALNLHGEIVEMKLKPTVSAYAPFFISSNNYGFFARGTWPGLFDFCQSEPHFVKIQFEGPELNFKLYRGSSPADIVCRHALETGPSFVPPKWALGPWRWRDNHVHRETYYDGTQVHAPINSEVAEDVLMMDAYEIPCTAYWLDRPWGPGPRGFDDYEFDPERFPNPAKMITWLNSKNIEMMIWIAPFVMGSMADIAQENGYFLKSNIWKESRQVLMDFTNEEACAWWGENGPAKLARMGIKGFKMDRADGEKLLDSLHLKTSVGTTYRENYNDYPVQYVKAAHKAVKSVLGEDFILFPRAQYTGSSRYGGLWSGDPRGIPEGLRSVVIALQRCSIMGYPIWGSDIGGYGRMFNRETCMRWLGFGCFSPIMENGPNVDRGFWNSSDQPSYDTELIAAWRLYGITRMKLVPYIHALAEEANQTGMPIVRPLFLVYSDQPESWKDWQTYLFGSDILVSVIWQKGKSKHTLYLPAGEKWIDGWDRNIIYEGGQYVEVDAPLYKIPVFIRKGAKIDLGDLESLYSESLKIAEKKPDLGELEKAEGWR